jgi:hypothetical protein
MRQLVSQAVCGCAGWEETLPRRRGICPSSCDSCSEEASKEDECSIGCRILRTLLRTAVMAATLPPRVLRGGTLQVQTPQAMFMPKTDDLNTEYTRLCITELLITSCRPSGISVFIDLIGIHVLFFASIPSPARCTVSTSLLLSCKQQPAWAQTPLRVFLPHHAQS